MGNKKGQITINNDKGRLTQEDVDRMIAEADKFKSEDTAQKEQTQAKQDLENYCYQILDVAENNALVEKLSESERETLETTCTDSMEWLEHNPDVKKEELLAKKRECEGKLKPLMTKMYAIKEDKKKSKAGGRRR